MTVPTTTSMWKTANVLGPERGSHVDSRSLGLFLKRHDAGDLEPEEVTEVTTSREGVESRVDQSNRTWIARRTDNEGP